MNGLSRPLAARLAVVGGVLALVGNVLHPRFDQSQSVDVYRAVAKSGSLIPADLLILVAALLITAGGVAIGSSMFGGNGHDAARLGTAAIAVGGSIAVLEIGLETYAFRQLAKTFVSADDTNRPGAFWATSAIDHVNSAMFSTWTILFVGLGPLLIGVAMLQSRAFPSWLAGLGVVGGLGCLVIGCLNLVREDQTALNIPFLVASLLVTAWVIAAGVWLARDPDPVRS